MGHKNRKYIPYRDSIQEYRKNEIGKKIDHLRRSCYRDVGEVNKAIVVTRLNRR